MANDLQGQPGPEAATTAAETTPAAPSPEVAAAAPGAAEPTPATPNPAPESASASEWDKVDAGAYQKLKDEYLSGTTPQGEPVAAPAEEPTPAAVEPEPPAAATPPEESEGPFGKGYRPRLGNLSKIKQETIQLVRELSDGGEDIDFAEAEKRVKAKYGLDAAPAAADQPPPGKNSADAAADIERIEADLIAAGNNADTAAIVTLNRDLRKAEGALREAQQAESDAAQAAAAALSADHAKAKHAIHGQYPGFKDAKSPISQKYLQLFDELEAAGDPIMDLSPTRQMQAIARMAALELGIKPVDPNAPSTPLQTQAPASTLPVSSPALRPPVLPVSGANRTSAPANQGAQIQQRIDSVKSMDDYEKLKNELIGV